MSIIQGTSKSSAAGYTIDQSIRFNDDDSAYLSRTPGSAGDRRTWTFSSWVKRANLFNGSVPQIIFSAANGSTLDFVMQFGQTDDTLRITDYSSGSASNLITTQLFRDPSAWYHFVLQYDTTQATSSDRMKLYVNGTQVTAFGTASYPSLNYDSAVNNNLAHNISRGAYSANGYFDGYQAEINFIDGTALDATSFGETNSDTGQWVPIKYTGSYGTNGFYITGADSADLGADDSGNGNDFTSSGLTTADQMLDTPTDNFCTLNPIQQDATGLSDGNLQFTTSSTGTHKMASATIAQSSGKWYCEVTCNAALGSNARIGIIPDDNDNYSGSDGHVGDDAASFAYVDNGQQESNNSQSSYGASYANGDVIAIALNLDDDEVTFYKNGASQGAISITAGKDYRFAASQYNAGGMAFNFGQASFSATPPTGFKALSTANLPGPTIADGSEYYHNQTYTGTGVSGLAITNDASAGDFKPDILWLSPRSNGDNKVFFDSVRGTTQRLKSNTTDAEDTDGTAQLTFETDGFDLDTTDVNFNGSGRTYVAWQWKTTGGTSSSNTDGNITSTVSANTTAGFSVLTYSGNGSDNQTIGHGLGIAPKMIWSRRRDTSGGWTSYHDAVGINQVFYLNSTSIPTSNTEQYRAVPTSSVYTVGVGGDINSSGGTYVSYVFAEVDGFSKISSYSGNGSTDGPFVYTGFKPSWLVIKRVSGGTGNWDIFDNKRDPINVVDAVLDADNNTAETTYSTIKLDFLSNGFKIRGTQTNINNSGDTYIYMAFAESPFKTATAR